MNDEQLLAEFEQILAAMPPKATLRHQLPENYAWFGRAKAAMHGWDSIRAALFNQQVSFLLSGYGVGDPFMEMMSMLYQARAELISKTIGPSAVAIGASQVFDYFDSLRNIIATATAEVFFVDPYLEADFVSKYLPHVKPGVTIRMLAEKKLQQLIPAAKAFAQQSSQNVEIRSNTGLHDRYVFLDKKLCYQSGASFKDGAKNAPTVINEIIDAATAILQIYEAKWSSGALHPI